LTFLLAASSAAIAAENKTEQLHINTVNIFDAKPLERDNPKYPIRAAKNLMEGWVILSYVIGQDGSTSNVIVEDSSNKVFESAAYSAIEKWRFSPAEQDGRAVQQCDNLVRMDFKFDQSPQGASRKFIAKYNSANQFLEQGNLDEFKRVLDEIEKKELNNFYEQMYFQILTYELAVKQNDKQKELSTIENLLFENSGLSEERFIFYAGRGFELAVHASRYNKALNIYKIVQDAYPESPFIASYKPFYDQITGYLASGEPIVLDAMIGERDFWRYSLSRNSFVIEKVTGKLTNLEVRCDYKHSQFLIESENMWTIPKSWGKCAVYVYGDKDTRFTFGELNSKDVI
jgi:TonB family protein